MTFPCKGCQEDNIHSREPGVCIRAASHSVMERNQGCLDTSGWILTGETQWTVKGLQDAFACVCLCVCEHA